MCTIPVVQEYMQNNNKLINYYGKCSENKKVNHFRKILTIIIIFRLVHTTHAYQSLAVSIN